MFGAMELTIPYDTLNTSEPLAFIKEISSDSNVNTVDILTPMIPALLYFSPQWMKFLMKPVLDYQATGKWPHPWAIHDIGISIYSICVS
jgi:hypothetical protein